MLRLVLEKMLFSWWSIYAWTGLTIECWVTVWHYGLATEYGMMAMMLSALSGDMWWKRMKK